MSVFADIFQFFASNRRTGSSTLIKEIADKNDVYVLVANIDQEKYFGKKGISMTNLKQVQGKQAKPILVDNYTMLQLSQDAYTKINQLSDKIKERDRMILAIKNTIAEFEHEHGEIKWHI